MSDNVSTRLTGNPNWDAAMLLLDTPMLRGRLDAWIEPECSLLDPEVLSASWSESERRLITLAVSLTNSGHSVSLYDAFDSLDNGNIRRVCRALQIAVVGHTGIGVSH